jgi:hypothetical protein
MSSQRPPSSPEPDPDARPTPAAVSLVVSLDDPRAVQILSTEHWSLLSHRSLAYNEAFVRGGMFLTFLSMSFVALALVAQGMTFGEDFLAVAAIVLAFDVVIGLTTYFRILGANVDDMRAVHGMARIRHGYTEIAPVVAPYFTAPTHDDPLGIGLAYGDQPRAFPGVLLYGLTTSGGMIGLIVSMVGGVLVGVLALMTGIASGAMAPWFGLGGAILVFALLSAATTGRVPRAQERLPVLFPTPTSPRDASKT